MNDGARVADKTAQDPDNFIRILNLFHDELLIMLILMPNILHCVHIVISIIKSFISTNNQPAGIHRNSTHENFANTMKCQQCLDLHQKSQ